MASVNPSRRRFHSCTQVVYERFWVSIGKISRGPSTVFEGCVYDRMDNRRILVEFQANGDEPCHVLRVVLTFHLWDLVSHVH